MGKYIVKSALFSVIIITCVAAPLKPQTIPAPAAVPEFSVQRGFYSVVFEETVSSVTPNATIWYTLDGSDPRTSVTVLQQLSPAAITIDPESTTGQRGKTPGVVLRACAGAPDYALSEPVTHTYIFLNKIGLLSSDGIKPGIGWPDPGYSPQYIDYGMDPAVLNDSRYDDLIDDALLDIPTISLVTDLKHLFGADSGIYMNAMDDGPEWERPASMELVNPDGAEGFHINAGIRIRGGWSAHPDNPKHAFRFFFRSEYGDDKLNYPLFENEGVGQFDKIDLRTSQNYAWSYPGHQGEYNIMIRDVFSRDLQREIGQPYTRSRFYHLYINGYYWGLFQTQERPEARFATSYFGGSVEDYDVVKVSGDFTYAVEATDGNLDAYRQVWELCKAGFSTNTNYFKIQGLNTDGSRNPGYTVLVDMDNLIDYMLIIFYAGNFDSPTTKFGSNKGPNNFYAIYNRNSQDGFRFFIHDAEHTLRTTWGEGPGIGLYENRVNIGTLTDGFKMEVSDFSRFHPQWLHFKLSSNVEYRIRFADHVYKHFFNQGWMTPAKTIPLFLSRAREIDLAIIGESARWGDTYLNPPGTKDDYWQVAIDDIVDNYFPVRTEIVLDQLKEVDLYPAIDPPVFSHDDITITANSLDIEAGYLLKLQNPNSNTGSIYYTTDGQDPRIIGGTVAASAVPGDDETEITVNTSTLVKARVLDGSTWSALHQLILLSDDSYANLKLTEIHYHPADRDTISDNEYEFLEFKNTGIIPIYLSQAYFTTGINYTFAGETILEPDHFIVLASNRDEFNIRYNFMPYGEYSGQLDNGGEWLTLCDAASDTILAVLYDDNDPWPTSPDGDGYSLAPAEINPQGDPNDPAYWRPSYAVHGSPGRDDTPDTSVNPPPPGMPTGFKLDQNFPNPFNPGTMIKYSLPTDGKVTLIVYDLAGREVSVLVKGFQTAGGHQVIFSAAGLSSGIYFYRLQTATLGITRKMVMLK